MNIPVRFFYLALIFSTGFSGLSCEEGNDDDSKDAGDKSTDKTGAVLAQGSWNGDQPNGVNFDVAVFPCPFSMPPAKASLNNPVDPDSGAVSGLVEDIPPGDWCVMAYIDMDPTDGLAPVPGKDATNATGQENENGALPIVITAGQTTELTLSFAIQGD